MIQVKRPKPKVEGSNDEDMAAIMNKQMMYIMPVMTVFIGMSFSGGLILYWFVSTLFTIFQQLFIFKKEKVIDISQELNNNNVIEGEVVKK